MEYKLDLKDRKILYELDRNCRKSYNQIGKSVGLSKTAVINRITQMEKSGLIKGYSAVINYGKLGFYNFRVYINLQNCDLKKEEEIIDFLKSKKIVSYIASMDGLYNLAFRVFTKDINEMYFLWEELMQKYVNYFNQRLIVLNIKTINFFRNYLVDEPKEDYEIISSGNKILKPLDDIDNKIIELLSENAKITILDIAKKSKTTPKTVISRIKRLEKEKIILFYRTILDSEKMNLLHFKLSILTMNIESKILKQFYEYIKLNPNIISKEETLGGEDIELDLEVYDLLKLESIVREIREKFGSIVQDYSVHHVLKENKN